MKNPVTSALHALEARRANTYEWSRLEREIAGPSSTRGRLDLEVDPYGYADQDSSQMRHYLAAQTSQTV